jgi:hypothetical protein
MSPRLSLALFLMTAIGLAQQVPLTPYDPTMDERVSVDGFVDLEDEEYPGFFVDKATGLTVHWGFDDSLLYVAVQTKGKGWLAIGFGSAKMHESNMFIGFYSDDSAEVYNHVGANYTHGQTQTKDSSELDWDSDIDFDDETGVTTMEFSYPLTFPAYPGLAIPGLAPSDTYDLILAQNTKSISFAAKHTHKSTLRFRMAPRPQPAKEAEPEKR